MMTNENTAREAHEMLARTLEVARPMNELHRVLQQMEEVPQAEWS